jgi:hypothetical protein
LDGGMGKGGKITMSANGKKHTAADQAAFPAGKSATVVEEAAWSTLWPAVLRVSVS